jgi:hypothetical protein
MAALLSPVQHVRLKVDVDEDWPLSWEWMNSTRRTTAPINIPMRMTMTRSCPIVSPSERFGVSVIAPH